MALIPHSILFLIVVLMLFSKSTSAWQPTFLYNVCPETTAMFGNHSQYQTNLNMVFRSLLTNAVNNPTGFYSTSAGNGTKDVVYGSFLCRGDQNTSFCHNCVVNATSIDFPKYCPNKKVAFIAYDECIVRYSNENIFGKMEKRPRYRLMNTINITGNMTQFTEFMVNMLNSTAMKAANGGPKKKFATAVLPYTSVQHLYGLAQCTPDLSARDCYDCLKIAIKMIPLSVGGRTSQPSCIVRYEDYPFWNGAFNVSSPPSPPQPTYKTTAAAPVLSPQRQPNGGKTTTKKVIVAVAVLVAATLVVLLAVGIHFITTRTKKTDYVASFKPADHVGEDLRTSESLQYDFSVLQCATNNFSAENKLGEGGFGGVYKGKLSNGQMIAVKRLSQSSSQGIQEFKNEVMVVAKLQHRNLVRLLGFCIAEEEKLLVYEYVPNNSLDSFLFDQEKQGQLGWEKRYNILHGIARGMLYLHHDSRLRIIHRDLKASNILLDASMIPKISDFGMAKIFGVDQTQENTNRVVGTYGYMAPEYAMHGQFSMKSDVYSFGVLVLEIVSGKKNSTFYESSTDEDLLSYAWKKWKEGIPLEFVDPSIRDSCTTHEAIRSIHLGLLCAQESIDQRPTMTKVVLAFDTDSVTLPLPEEPTFSMKTMSASRFAKRLGYDQSSNTSTPWSMNEASITELEPR